MPKEACVCEEIGKTAQRIQVTTDRKRYGKIVTVVSGFDKGVDVKRIAKTLKNELACGGTYKENTIELQGEHTSRVKSLLEGLDFNVE